MRIVSLFREYQVTDEEFRAVKRRVREEDFRGTSYSPLPDESALIRIIREVQSGQAVNHQHHAEPMRPATETREEAYGVIIAGDWEKIVRDRYFFRDMVRAGAIFGSKAYPEHWLDEAHALMDDRHKASYDRAPDDAGRPLVIRHYYEHLDLPARESKSPAEVAALREEGIRTLTPWSRYR